MKLLVAVAVVLAVLALTRAESESNPAAVDTAANVAEEDSSAVTNRPPRRARPGRPGRPIPREQPDIEQAPENEVSQEHPPRQQVFFDVNFKLGKQNIIRRHRENTTTTTTMAA